MPTATRRKLTPAEREWMRAYSHDPAIKRTRARRAAALRALRAANVTEPDPRYQAAEQAMFDAVDAFNQHRPYPISAVKE